ncbi:MAG TPA: hypothetical protein PLI62_04445 [Spirochaetota bacterium]|nr:hypothetical protein [Spirochaetota bacterium]
MWKVPQKYITKCVSTVNGKDIQNLEIEAINWDEAENRAYLNCMLLTDPDKNIRVEVTRV